MEVQKPQILIAKRIGISETDVENCRNITQLRNWKIEIGKDMTRIGNKKPSQAVTS
jgi:biotin operon repressor